MFVRGVSATTLDDVRAASNTSKSQLYYHFADKDALVLAVIDLQADEILERQDQQLRRLNSIRGLQRWRDAIVQGNALRNGAYGCPLGSLASELSDRDEDARRSLADYFARWEGLLTAGLTRMREAGVLRDEADPQKLATGLMAALQGGYLLAQTAHDSAPMRIALDMGIDQVQSFAVAKASAVRAR
jgi:TetR/AcrR family transcriptional regulator, transcriptional repressor for nem operon